MSISRICLEISATYFSEDNKILINTTAENVKPYKTKKKVITRSDYGITFKIQHSCIYWVALPLHTSSLKKYLSSLFSHFDFLKYLQKFCWLREKNTHIYITNRSYSVTFWGFLHEKYRKYNCQASITYLWISYYNIIYNEIF